MVLSVTMAVEMGAGLGAGVGARAGAGAGAGPDTAKVLISLELLSEPAPPFCLIFVDSCALSFLACLLPL